ncbi:MAG TPA: glycosyltransferase family 39 protein [Candidatus Paceibacterota bacterium]|nr:glycosyltransferase family 39 protein [Candidatus Pacearchaeota archaeon]HRZ51147.1 glycosyltransferase family 39 protein [Candidatus Paceibacterota bacterium]HSA36846.1 glycosyltransferase family 39 protein [Candidatus Paceibacterota bacterium]
MKLTNRTANILAGFMFLIMSVLMLFSIKGDALTMDEKSHLPAGYSYLTRQDMRINPEHPPLVKDLAGLPLLFIDGINFPAETKAWNESINGQWDFGWSLLFNSDNPADSMIFWGRIPMILVTLIAGFFVYKWTKELFGNTAAVLSAFLFAFSPTIIAHGKLVTTDVAAALGALIGLYYFTKALKDPTRKNTVYSGIALGIAECLKFSMILLFPLFILLSGLWWFAGGASRKTVLRLLFFVFFICFLVIGPVYLFHTWNYPPERQVSDSEYILSTYGSRFLADTVVWAADKPVIRAYGQYFLGVLMVSQRVAGGNTTYFMGEISKNGWLDYFPTVYLIKETVAFHLFSLIAFFYGIWFTASKMRGKFNLQLAKELVKNNFPILAILSFVGIYWFTSMAGNLNIGVRHLLPVIPLTIILAGAGAAAFIGSSASRAIVIGLLCFSQVVSVSAVYPSFIAYFNELAGGPSRGYLYAVDSNLDWGQDLKRLASWTDENNVDEIYVDYFGGADVKYYLGDKYRPWWGNRPESDLPNGSYLAVSATFLQGGRGYAKPGADIENGYYLWLNSYEPVAIIGHSIFVYRID